MHFRLKAFSIHLAASATVLLLVALALYFGWYRWPGWFLSGVGAIVLIMAGVDLTLGPTLTLLIANPAKPRRELARDVAIIAAVQVAALCYAVFTMWSGRPLYYAYSVDRIEIVQASDITADEIARAMRDNPAFAPRWYSLPRWVWAPLPDDKKAADAIVVSAISGGADVVNMPRLFRPWDGGVSTLRGVLKPLDSLTTISGADKQRLRQRLVAAGFPPDSPNVVLVTGRGAPLAAVIDPATGRVVAVP